MKFVTKHFLGYLSDFLNGTPRRVKFQDMRYLYAKVENDPDVVSYKDELILKALELIRAHEQDGESKGEESPALANAYYQVGLFQEFARDMKGAIAYYDKAIGFDHAGAMVRRAHLLWRGVSDRWWEKKGWNMNCIDVDNNESLASDRSLLEGIELYDRAVVLGDTEAMVHRAHIHKDGFEGTTISLHLHLGVETSLAQATAKATSLLNEASELGDAEAMAVLGRIHESQRRYQEAVELYERAIGLGNINAMLYRAMTYKDKEVLEDARTPDYAKAIRLFDKASALECLWSQHFRREVFQEKKGTDADTVKKLLELIWPDWLEGQPLSKETMKSFNRYSDEILDRVKTIKNLKQLKNILAAIPDKKSKLYSVITKYAEDPLKLPLQFLVSFSRTESGIYDANMGRRIYRFWDEDVRLEPEEKQQEEQAVDLELVSLLHASSQHQ